MKPGDLVKYSYPEGDLEGEMGLVLLRLVDSALPRDWPRIVVLWNDGTRESMHEEDLEVFSESG